MPQVSGLKNLCVCVCACCALSVKSEALGASLVLTYLHVNLFVNYLAPSRGVRCKAAKILTLFIYVLWNGILAASFNFHYGLTEFTVLMLFSTPIQLLFNKFFMLVKILRRFPSKKSFYLIFFVNLIFFEDFLNFYQISIQY
jgi:hypothetical protein